MAAITNENFLVVCFLSQHAPFQLNVSFSWLILVEVSFPLFVPNKKSFRQYVHIHIECLAQHCSDIIANALELPQSCTKPSICKEKIFGVVYSLSLYYAFILLLIPLLVFRIVRSLWNLTGTSAALLPRCLLNFKAMRYLKLPISRLRGFTRSHDKTSYRILKWDPGADSILHTTPYDKISQNHKGSNKPVKLPWIFSGAPFISNGVPETSRVTGHVCSSSTFKTFQLLRNWASV